GIGGDKSEGRPGTGEVRLAATKHKRAEVETILVDETEVGEAQRVGITRILSYESNGFVERVVHGANVEVDLLIVIRHVGEPFSVSMVVARVATLPRLRR